jgi:hypothetical protein
MKRFIVNVGVCIAALAALAGCLFEESGPVGGTTTPVSAPTRQSTRAAFTPRPTNTYVANTGEIAPHYAEIRQDVFRITRRDVNPQGPEVDRNGIVDPQMRAEFATYADSLKGKTAQGWQGWVGEFTQSDLTRPGTVYNVAVFMETPQPGKSPHQGALLLNVSRQRMEELQLGVDLDNRFISWEANWPQIVFSGTIVDLNPNGRVHVADVVVEEVK